MHRLWLALGAGFAFAAVALGAFGAHGLRAVISAERLRVWETGAHYHLMHAVAILVVALLVERNRESAGYRRAAALFTAGILLFSGSLYLLAVTGIRLFGAITPLGGICFLAGWAALAWTALRRSGE